MLIDDELIQVSHCQTHHVDGENPLYDKVFLKVLKFHKPGLAPVVDASGAYHIDYTGAPSYQERFIKTYGYYHGFAAVVDQDGWIHLDTKGNRLYEEKYLWCGNFQENLCVVRTPHGYFHIDTMGGKSYQETYQYAGDYKDGIAVVQQSNKYFHINIVGKKVHENNYLFLDVYHKGYARAQDENGWFHVNSKGLPAYTNRYKYIEPFYNDVALVQTFANNFSRIDSNGEVVERTLIQENKSSNIGSLSGKMVGFWQLFVIHAAVKLKILDQMPATSASIAEQCNMTLANTQRLLKGLWEIELIVCSNNTWSLTEQGDLLAPSTQRFMASAVYMWLAVSKEWDNLTGLLKNMVPIYHPCFKDDADLHDLVVYQDALLGYADHDFYAIAEVILTKECDTILVAGSCARSIIPRLLTKQKNLRVTYLDSVARLRDFTIWPSYQTQVSVLSTDLFKPWSDQYDCLIFPRYLHYWPDHDVKEILLNAVASLSKSGRIIILEMLLQDDSSCGGLLDLNMMVETGGKLRTKNEWVNLMISNNMILSKTEIIQPYLSMLEFKHASC